MTDVVNPKEPTNEEVLAAVQKFFGHPAVQSIIEQPVIQRMLELDRWGKEKGLGSEQRADIIKAISSFLVAASDIDVGREYIARAVVIIAEIGPALVDSSTSSSP